MKQRRNHPMVGSAYIVFFTWALATALLMVSACSSNSSSGLSAKKTAEQGATGQNQSEAARGSGDSGINLNCVYDHLQNPPEAFHYAYKKSSSDGSRVDQEADVSPQAIDGFRDQPDGSQQPIHAVHSDPESWKSALAGLTGISGMSGTVSTFSHTSAMQRESDAGVVNGYQAAHYSIDTTRWDAATQQTLGSFTLGPGGFDKGDAWVAADGCPVKLILDEEMHKKDGSLLGSVHYEVSMAKK